MYVTGYTSTLIVHVIYMYMYMYNITVYIVHVHPSCCTTLTRVSHGRLKHSNGVIREVVKDNETTLSINGVGIVMYM